jgi:hypothetical protein
LKNEQLGTNKIHILYHNIKVLQNKYSKMAYQKVYNNIAKWNNETKPLAMNEKKINQFISHQLVKAREEMNYTQMKVQEDKVMTQSNLSKIENGAKNISAAKLFLLSTYYKKPIEFFFEKWIN